MAISLDDVLGADEIQPKKQGISLDDLLDDVLGADEIQPKKQGISLDDLLGDVEQPQPQEPKQEQPKGPKIGFAERLTLGTQSRTGVDNSESAMGAIASAAEQATLGTAPLAQKIQELSLKDLAKGSKRTLFRGDVPYSEMGDYELTGAAIGAGIHMPFADSALAYWDKNEAPKFKDETERKKARVEYVQGLAQEVLKDRLQKKQEAGQQLETRDKTLGAKIGAGGLENVGYMSTYMLGAPAAIGASAAGRFGDVTSDKLTVDEEGNIQMQAKGDGMAYGGAKAVVGGVAEYTIEKYLEKPLGWLGSKIAKAPVIREGLRMAAGTKAGKIAAQTIKTFGKIGKYTGVQSLPVEVGEEWAQAMADDVVGFGLRADEAGKTFGEATSDFVKQAPDIICSMLIIQGTQGGTAAANDYHQYAMESNRIDGTLKAFGATDELLSGKSLEDKQNMYRVLKKQLTPEKATKMLRRLGNKAQDVYDGITQQEGWDFKARESGIKPTFKLPDRGLSVGESYTDESSGVSLLQSGHKTVIVINRDGNVMGEYPVAQAIEAANTLSMRNQVQDNERRNKAEFIKRTAQRISGDLDVVAYNTMDDALKANPELAKEADYDKSSTGFFNGGKIHIVLDNIKNPFDAVNTILHEGGVHAGLREVLRGNGEMGQFLNNLSAPEVEGFKGWVAKNGYMSSDQAQAEEALAYMYENRIANPTGFQKAVSWLHDKIRTVNKNYAFTDSDIEVMMAAAHNSVTGDKGEFSRVMDTTAQNNTAVVTGQRMAALAEQDSMVTRKKPSVVQDEEIAPYTGVEPQSQEAAVQPTQSQAEPTAATMPQEATKKSDYLMDPFNKMMKLSSRVSDMLKSNKGILDSLDPETQSKIQKVIDGDLSEYKRSGGGKGWDKYDDMTNEEIISQRDWLDSINRILEGLLSPSKSQTAKPTPAQPISPAVTPIADNATLNNVTTVRDTDGAGIASEPETATFLLNKEGSQAKPSKVKVQSPISNVSDAKKARAAELIARMNKRTGRLNAGLDPENLIDGIELASIYIEGGVKTFAQFARAMKEASTELYEKIKDHLITIWTGAQADNPGIEELTRTQAKAVIDAIDAEAQTEYSNNQEEQDNVPSTPDSMEQDSPLTVPQDKVGESDVQPQSGRGAAGSGLGKSVAEIQGELAQDDFGLFDSPPAPDRAQGDTGIRGSNAGLGGGIPGSAEQDGGGNTDDQGSNDVGAGDETTLELASEDGESDSYSLARAHQSIAGRVALQKKADTIPVKIGNRQNIAETLPLLFEGQQDDVAFTEERFSKEDGYGVMFTNGTGTGKTYTGMGVIKRMLRSGKKNILIVAPNQGVIDAWQAAGKDLGITIERIPDTSTAGKGVCITTYKGLADNDKLTETQWDMIVPDESHNLMSNQNGKHTSYSRNLRAISYHPEGLYTRMNMKYRDLHERIIEARRKRQESLEDALLEQWKQKETAMKAEFEAKQGKNRTRVMFLSATPFAYQANIEYAEGYLFDYGTKKEKEAGSRYNEGSAREKFFMQHFGMTMRTNKLTRAGAGVDNDIMQRQFNEYLRKQGVLSRRMLDVEADYQRKFATVEDMIGKKIDEGIDYLMEAEGGRYRAIAEYVGKKFDYLNRMFLLEAIKAKHAVPIIKEMLANGRKVVLFHDFNVGGGFNPFDLSGMGKNEEVVVGRDSQGKQIYERTGDLIEEVIAKRPDIFRMDFSSLREPIVAMRNAFPNALFINGNVSKGNRKEALRKFNDDASGPQLLVIQSDAGREGISAHDISGKYRRNILNLGLPIKPTSSIQQEGRIYRTGQHPESHATFVYMNTGTSFERFTFAQKVFERSATAENLAMGDDARSLRKSFIEAFESAEPYTMDENEGRGGKEADKKNSKVVSEFERAKTFYWGTQKRTAKNKSREGADYFATPEPLGQKMVEWLNLKADDRVLEPSAGHGAISRFFPETTKNTIVEPSTELLSRASLTTNARIIQDRFENVDIGNKYDGIAMNPPFGTAGRTAVDHIAKAFEHLHDGGRIVAIMPEGSAIDKFDKWYGDTPNAQLVKIISLPPVVFGRAGTSVKTRVVIIDRLAKRQERNSDYSEFSVDADDINEFFDKIENMSTRNRTEAKSPPLPQKSEAAILSRRDGVLPVAAPVQEIVDDLVGTLPIEKIYHTKRQQDVFIVKPSIRTSTSEFNTMHNAAKHKGGWYSRAWGNAPAGFAFETVEKAEAFAKQYPKVFKRESVNAGSDGYNSSDTASDQTDATRFRRGVSPRDVVEKRYVRAMPSTDPRARTLQAEVEVAYAYDLTPTTVQGAMDRAQGVYEADKTKAQMDLLYGRQETGDINVDAERMAIDKIAVNDLNLAAINDPTDEKIATAMLGNWQWFGRGTDIGRALQLRVDPLNTPEARRAWLLRNIFEPSKSDADIIRKAQNTKEAITKLMEKAKYARKILEALKKKRIDVLALTADQLMDDVYMSNVMQQLAVIRSNYGDMFHEYRRNSMLSAITTPAINTIGNLGHAMLEAFVQRPIEALMNTVVKNPDAATFRSINAMYKAITPSLLAANKAFLKSWVTEKPVVGPSASKLDESGVAIPSKTVTVFGKEMEIGGKQVRWSQRIMMATDEWFKTVFMAMLTADYATREFDKLVSQGKRTEDQREAYVLKQVDPASASYFKAYKEALRWTFQNDPGRFAASVMHARNDNGFVGFILKLMFPFVKTPANIVSAGVRKTPLGAIPYIYNLTKGNYKGGEAMRLGAEQAVGMVIMMSIYALMKGDDEDEFNRPRITGARKSGGRTPNGAKENEMQNAPPMSIRVGDKWISYSRLEPAATMVSTIVDLLTAWDQAKDEKYAEIPVTLFSTLKGNVSDKTYMQGLGEIVSIVEGDEYAIERAGVNMVSSLVPNILKSSLRSSDPYIRDMRNRDKGLEYLKTSAKRLGQTVLPAASLAPIPKMDKTGKPIEREGGALYNAIVPFRLQSATKTTKVDAMLSRWNEKVDKEDRFYPATPSPRKVKIGRDELSMNDEEYVEFQRIAGEHAAMVLGRQSFNFDNPTERDIERVKKIYENARNLAAERVRPMVVRRWRSEQGK